MFSIQKQWGDHTIFKINDISKYKMREYFTKIYNCENLLDLQNPVEDNDNGSDTELHKIFYNDIKQNDDFKNIYCSLIKDIYEFFFTNENCLIYQSYPSIRIQFENNIVVPKHYDSDNLSNHPNGEKNFLFPITDMENTNSIYIESQPNKQDFQSIKLEYGELFYFNGNKCTHYNEKNVENRIRISLDFRIILLKDYINYLNNSDIIQTNPRDLFWKREPKFMQIGGYYQIVFKNDNLENMKKWFTIKNNIMQHRPTFGIEEANACHKYMLDDNFVTEHKQTAILEQMICEKLNCKNCIMTTSGTAALLLALMSLDLNDGDEVIVPNYTMIATVNAIQFLKLKPVIIDVNSETFTIDCDEIRKNITTKTKCVIHVSLNNRYTDMEKIVELCKELNIHLIEDAAQSFGCKINSKSIGTFGKIGCFSLSTPKIISTGQGGFIVTDDTKIAEKINMIKNFGRKQSGVDDFVVFGLNFKYTDIQAVIGIEQVKKIDERVKRMREIYNLYYNNLKNIVHIKPPLSDEWIPWFVDIYIDDRENICKILKKHKIETRPVYGEINKTNMYYSEQTLVNSNFVSTNGLFLPSYITLSDEEITYICNIIKMIYSE
jgi:perosamine synthetase